MLTLATDIPSPTFALVAVDDLSQSAYRAIDPSTRDTLTETTPDEPVETANITFVVADARVAASANAAIVASRGRAGVSDITALVIPDDSPELTGDLAGAPVAVIRVGGEDLAATMARIIEAPLVAMEGGIIGWRHDDLLPVIGGQSEGVGLHGVDAAELATGLAKGTRPQAVFALVRLHPEGSLHDINAAAMQLSAELGDDVDISMAAVIDEALSGLEVTVIGTRAL